MDADGERKKMRYELVGLIPLGLVVFERFASAMSER
jgi:hypothetical protein